MRNDWKDVFLSSVGRMSRVPFLLAAAVVVALAGVYQEAVGALGHWITGWLAYPALAHLAASVLSKRLHDRGRSGWWSAIILLAAILAWPSPHGLAAALAAPVLIIAAVELVVLPGQPGPNRYGPNPLARLAAS